MVRWIAALLVAALPAAAGRAGDIARALRDNSLDITECYRVRDLTMIHEDLRIYLTDGHLIFSKPVAGRRTAAVFTADVEGGDAEVLLLPPDRAERQSLATYTRQPNLDEHFRAALFLFTSDEYDALLSQFTRSPANRKALEAAPLLAEEWNSVLRNMDESYQTRLTLDLLSRGAPAHGLFAGMISGNRLGNFDVIVDPDAIEEVVAGQVAARDDRVYFDTWTSFRARSVRGNLGPRPTDLVTTDYRIDATIAPDLSMSVVTRVKVRPVEDGMAAALFQVSPAMRVSQALVDGRPAEVLQRDSLRSDLTFGDNGAFLVVPAEPLRAGRDYEFEFHHDGKVIYDAGDRVFFVGARSNWYPIHGLQFSTYDLRFRYPADLDLVASGDVMADRKEGDSHLTRWRTAAPVRMAGFNLGRYVHARVQRGGFTIDVCANRDLERALQPGPAPVIEPPPPFPSRRPANLPPAPAAPLSPSPAGRLQALAADVDASLEFMTARFGRPALPHLTVSPIPGTFGQGFPGLIYLSTLAYLRNLPRTNGPVPPSQEIFFQDMLVTHEVAHQWWGNRVAAATYRDNWLMEALANFSALLYVEKTKGARIADVVLDNYRSLLLAKDKDGQITEEAGPIVLGGRLQSSLSPAGWRDITYGKGIWIMQMLRRRLGDEAFLAVLADILRREDRSLITTEQFRALAAARLPPKSDDPQLETFFDNWVYGTGVPELKLTYSVRGKAPACRLRGTVTQSEVGADFSALAPVEIQTTHGHSITQWVRTGSDPATFSVTLRNPPLKVTLDPSHALLRR